MNDDEEIDKTISDFTAPIESCSELMGAWYGSGSANSIKSHALEQTIAGGLFHADRFPLASRHYQKAIKTKPGCYFCWFNLGNCYQKDSKFIDAVVCYKEALRWRADLDAALLNLGVAYLQLGKKYNGKNPSASKSWAIHAIKNFKCISSDNLMWIAKFYELLTLRNIDGMRTYNIEFKKKMISDYKALSLYSKDLAEKIDMVEIRREVNPVRVRLRTKIEG